MKFAIYARKSTDSEDRQARSIGDQINDCEKIAKENNLEVVEVITEKKSAKLPGRPGFAKLIKLIENREIDGIICWGLDRLARNVLDGGAMTHFLQTEIIKKIHTTRGEYDKNTNTIVLQIEFAMAVQEIRELARRIDRGIQKSFEDGFFPISSVPLGYKRVKKGIIEPDEKKFLIKKLFEFYANDHFSISSLAEKMNELGLRTKNQRKITKNTIEIVLNNPIYCGITRRNFRNKKKPTEFFAGSHESIISKNLWEKCQKKLHGKKTCGEKNKIYLFSKQIKCDCGWFLANYEQKKNIYLECRNPDCGKKFLINGKWRKTLREDFLLQKFADIFKNIKIPPEMQKKISESLKNFIDKKFADQKNYDQILEKKLKNLRQKEENLVQDRLARIFSQEEFLAEKNKIIFARKKITEQLAESSGNGVIDEILQKFLAIGDLIEKRFSMENGAEKKYYFELLVSEVKIQEGCMLINFSELGKWLFAMKFPNDIKCNFELAEDSCNKEKVDFLEKKNVWCTRQGAVRTNIKSFLFFLNKNSNLINSIFNKFYQ